MVWLVGLVLTVLELRATSATSAVFGPKRSVAFALSSSYGESSLRSVTAEPPISSSPLTRYCASAPPTQKRSPPWSTS